MNKFKFPLQFVPYERLTVCNNELVNCKAILNHKGFYPILIGKGIFPQIWIYSKYRKHMLIQDILLVERSISKVNYLKVDIDLDKQLLTIKYLDYNEFSQNVILSMSYANLNPVIDVLDLRPIGYDIHGSSSGLNAGTGLFSGNTMVNIDAMFAI